MYRQVQVTAEHTNYQRILWRRDPNDSVKAYALTTVTYGTAPASFLAIRCLQEIARNYKETHPNAANIITRDFYVDDLITGVETLPDGRNLIRDVSLILKSGGFELRKWNSNEEALFTQNCNASEAGSLELEKEMQGKILGLTWTSTHDDFKYSAVEQESVRVTKRVILSRIARIFDPLGLVGPVIISAKLILQRLWKIKSDWDESVPQQLYSEWMEYSKQLIYLNKLSIPRRITQNEPVRTAIHGFSDASEIAYGACLYLWSMNNQGFIKTALICAKSRVAPLKNITLPRLELCGAQLLVQLCKKVVPCLNIKIDKHFYWTDSQIVLAWIGSESKSWKTFVSNRVGEIQECTHIEDWGHVKSEDNPADLLSRGIDPQRLLNCELWWHGPHWLHYDESHWPIINSHNMQEGDIWQERKSVSLIAALNDNTQNQLILKFSTFKRLQRVLSYCFRFVENLRRPKVERITGPLQPEELKKTTRCIIKIVQHEEFREDIAYLKKFKHVHNKSRLLALKPFLDDNDMLRVGGRLKNSSYSFNVKHPFLLPSKHFVTKLIISHAHIKLCHAGSGATLANLRQQFWLISGLTSVKSVLRKCVKCFRARPTPAQHLMGDLPQARVDRSTRPFIETGIDYCGPFMIREGSKRSRKQVKVYIAVFVCFATKAAHLEIVLDLSSETFLNALKRFMSRRGKPNTMNSDNGTNFVGADRVLTEFFESQDFQKGVIEPIQQEEITWKFIPPRSPHFGGLWEATVKSFKTQFKRTVGNASLTYEEFSTVVIQIEACLNSRPLIPISSDPNDLSVLTPSHLLIGDLLTAPMEHDVRGINENRLSRWQRVQQITHHFWDRWSTEYISQLQQRSKWRKDIGNPILEGSMVIIKDDQQPPLRWAIGRVISIHPGTDGITRAATVRTSRGNFTRATAKLCLLPVDS